jgi:uncharacterized protein
MEPYYFGPGGDRLFGCYHRGHGAAPRRAVVLCQPMGHEYMACYRAMRQTAARLADAGVPAFRFDFYGAGDSPGASDEGRPSRWIADVTRAADEIRRRERDADVMLLGWRFGATLALLSRQQDRTPPQALILWDPIVNGAAYLDELAREHAARFGGSADEVLGFPMSRALRDEVKQVDLLEVTAAARRVLIVETAGAAADLEAFASRLASLGAAVERRTVAGPPIWHAPNKAAVPAHAVQSIVAWTRNLG